MSVAAARGEDRDRDRRRRQIRPSTLHGSSSIASLPLPASCFSSRPDSTSSSIPSSFPAIPSAIMLGRPSGIAFAMSFIGISTSRAPALSIDWRLLAAARIADHKTVRAELDFGAEPVGVEPVDADKQIEMVGHAFDRTVSEAQQGRGFAAADLRSHGPGQKTLPSGCACSLKDQISHRKCTGATAPGNGNGKTGRFPHRRTFREAAARLCRFRR